MRSFLLILTVCFSKFATAQQLPDTTITLRALDSIKTEVYRFRDSLKRMQYAYRAVTECYTTDSSQKTRDSVVFRYYSKNHQLLKVHSWKYRDDDVTFNYETLAYMNRSGLPEFVEHWERARSDKDENGRSFTWKIYTYERFAYDAAGRVTVWVLFEPALSRSKVRRCEYTYGASGVQNREILMVPVEKFWD